MRIYKKLIITKCLRIFILMIYKYFKVPLSVSAVLEPYTDQK
jgi:hypothetical protein